MPPHNGLFFKTTNLFSFVLLGIKGFGYIIHDLLLDVLHVLGWSLICEIFGEVCNFYTKSSDAEHCLFSKLLILDGHCIHQC